MIWQSRDSDKDFVLEVENQLSKYIVRTSDSKFKKYKSLVKAIENAEKEIFNVFPIKKAILTGSRMQKFLGNLFIPEKKTNIFDQFIQNENTKFSKQFL